MSAVLLRAGELAQRLNGELIGDPQATGRGLEVLERAGPEHVSFARDAANLERWVMGKGAIALVSRPALSGRAGQPAVAAGRALIVVPDADDALVSVLESLAPPPPAPSGVHVRAVVENSARLGAGVSVGPCACVGAGSEIGDGTYIHANAVIGANVRIGRGCIIYPGAVICDHCVLGDRVILQPGAVIGADGFGYRPEPSGQGIRKIPHLGNVEIHSLVEIGANTTIDRAKFGSTVVGAVTKIDNQVQVGHGCRIGRACLICGTCALAGSVTLGDGVTLGGGVGIADNLTIGSGAIIGARSGVMHNVPPGEKWLGYPARKASEQMRFWALHERLPNIVVELRRHLRAAEAGAPAEDAEG